MENKSFLYVPEVFTRLVREGIEANIHYEFAKKGLGVLTENEAREDIVYWKERMSEFYKKLGWDSKLIEIMNNN